MVFFHILELLKSSSITDVTWKIIFEIVCKTLLKNFEIGTVLYENDLVAKSNCHRQSSQFFSAQDSVQSFAILLQHDIFHFPKLLGSQSN